MRRRTSQLALSALSLCTSCIVVSELPDRDDDVGSTGSETSTSVSSESGTESGSGAESASESESSFGSASDSSGSDETETGSGSGTSGGCEPNFHQYCDPGDDDNKTLIVDDNNDCQPPAEIECAEACLGSQCICTPVVTCTNGGDVALSCLLEADQPPQEFVVECEFGCGGGMCTGCQPTMFNTFCIEDSVVVTTSECGLHMYTPCENGCEWVNDMAQCKPDPEPCLDIECEGDQVKIVDLCGPENQVEFIECPHGCSNGQCIQCDDDMADIGCWPDNQVFGYLDNCGHPTFPIEVCVNGCNPLTDMCIAG